MNNPYDFFEYKGKKYGVGTVYRSINQFNKSEYRYHTYYGNNSNGKYIFFQEGSTTGFNISKNDLQKYNIEIVQEFKPGECVKQTKSGKTTAYIDYSIETIWYIIAMGMSLFFKEWYLVWIGATLVYFAWRRHKRGE